MTDTNQSAKDPYSQLIGAQTVFMIEIALLLIEKGVLTREELTEKLKLYIEGARTTNSKVAIATYIEILESMLLE